MLYFIQVEEVLDLLKETQSGKVIKMGLKVIDGTPSSISKFIRENEMCELGQEHMNNPPKCLICGKTMHMVKDKFSGKYTGFSWRCECMPKNITMGIL